MGFVKFYRANTIDTPDKPRTPVSSGHVFSTLIKGKTIDGMGWYGDEHNVDQAHIGFTDGTYLLIGWATDFECPAVTYVQPKK